MFLCRPWKWLRWWWNQSHLCGAESKWRRVCLFSCVFNNGASFNPAIQPPGWVGGGGRLICSHAGWYRLTEAIIFEMFFAVPFPVLAPSPVFLLWWVGARSKWSLSSDIACQSRQEKCSLKVTLLWCLLSVCHRTFHFLWAKIYNLSFDRRSKHL